jgi:hypothetical protein
MAVYPEDFLVYSGRSFTAEWYYTTEGNIPAYEYYKIMPDTDQGRFRDMIQHFCDRPFGIMLPKTMYRIEDPQNQIYVFKPRDERFFNFTTEGPKVIITNAYHKHSHKMTKADKEKLKVAARYRADYLQRVKEATYYVE